MRPGENIGPVIGAGQFWNGVAMFRNEDDSNRKSGGVGEDIMSYIHQINPS